MKFPKLYSRLNQSDSDSFPPQLPAEDGEPPKRRYGSWAVTGAYILLAIVAAASCAAFGYVVARQNILLRAMMASTPASSPAPAPAPAPAPPMAPAHNHDHGHDQAPASVPSSVPTMTPKPPSGSELHCGNSSTEARVMGCVFDLLTNNWMPKYCADPITDAEYREWVLDPSRQLGAWAFYHDEQGQKQVASEEALSDLVGAHIYTTTENHLAHCAFLARRMHRLVTGDIAAVAHNTLAHTLHCTKAILKAVESNEPSLGAQIGSTFDVGIVSCLVEDK
ncbi:hypothetical protein BBK36DRAFT_1144990 [Trichoderma citrinoviride]|uniref:Uncharacterized protein n=1 Tax=Trichoderma citrinoviride TaxID=58853 RepID=A0A2T4AYQ3_9HYPO|nr:hypothetical protein BBK36DRAFT_1144990 [Trichoderma citrinoviride]PTB62197.1 hypothetical protein BBK36DRAFT_1144990 [Trichoderma citrinoviride]